MRKNKLKKIFKEGKAAVNGWLQIPSSFTSEVMSKQGWDSLTLDLQHGLIDYSSMIQMFQAISASETVPMARLSWNEPGQIMKVLDAGSYGVICPMINNKDEAEQFVKACLYPPLGFRSYGPIRGVLYGGQDYFKYANEEIIKFVLIETAEALNNLDKIMSTKGLDGVYVGPADLSISLGEKPGFDKPETDPVYKEIMKILKHAQKNGLVAGIQNRSPDYAFKMIKKGFQFVTIGSDQRYLATASQESLNVLKKNLNRKPE